jgi:hypothetical protein
MITSLGLRLGAATILGFGILQLTGCGGLDVTVQPDEAAQADVVSSPNKRGSDVNCPSVASRLLGADVVP